MRTDGNGNEHMHLRVPPLQLGHICTFIYVPICSYQQHSFARSSSHPAHLLFMIGVKFFHTQDFPWVAPKIGLWVTTIPIRPKNLLVWVGGLHSSGWRAPLTQNGAGDTRITRPPPSRRTHSCYRPHECSLQHSFARSSSHPAHLLFMIGVKFFHTQDFPWVAPKIGLWVTTIPIRPKNLRLIFGRG